MLPLGYNLRFSSSIFAEYAGNATKEGAAGETIGSSTPPSAKDASTQGATAGSAEKKGDATTPGGTMKK
jgi:hypothetical protein